MYQINTQHIVEPTAPGRDDSVHCDACHAAYSRLFVCCTSAHPIKIDDLDCWVVDFCTDCFMAEFDKGGAT